MVTSLCALYCYSTAVSHLIGLWVDVKMNRQISFKKILSAWSMLASLPLSFISPSDFQLHHSFTSLNCGVLRCSDPWIKWFIFIKLSIMAEWVAQKYCSCDCFVEEFYHSEMKRLILMIYVSCFTCTTIAYPVFTGTCLQVSMHESDMVLSFP